MLRNKTNVKAIDFNLIFVLKKYNVTLVNMFHLKALHVRVQ